MADQDDLSDTQRLEQRVGVLGERLEAILIALGFGRLAEADLIGRDHAVAVAGERPNRRLPGRGAEILAVKKDRHRAVRRRGRGHIHVAHGHGLALGREGEVLDRPWIGEALELRAESRRLGKRRGPGEQQSEGDADAKNCLLNSHRGYRRNCRWNLKVAQSPACEANQNRGYRAATEMAPCRARLITSTERSSYRRRLAAM